VTLALAAFVRPGPIPDGPEMAAAGGCLLRLGLDSAACAGTEPFFWMPAFPLLSGLFGLLTDPWAAAHAAAALVAGLLVLPLAAIGRRLDVPHPALVAGALLLATPAVHDLVAHPSGRGLAWLAVLGAVALAARVGDQAGGALRRGAAIGALLALALLSRREAAGQALLVGLALVPLAPRVAATAAATGAGLVLPWFALLGLAAGSPRTSGRAWEPLVYPWDGVIPHEWLLMEISMGTWGSPLRAAVSRLPASADGAQLDPAVVLPWLRYALPVAVPAWLAVLAAAGAALLLRRAGGWRAVAAAGALALPALPLAILPNARAVELPAQNLHPVVLAATVLAAVAAGGFVRLAAARLPAGRFSAPALAIALLGAASAGNAAWVARVVPTDSGSPATLPGAGAVLAEAPGPVATTLTSAPAARRADRPRRALPSPYRLQEAPLAPGDRVLLTDLDLPGAARTLREAAPALRPSHAEQDGEAWALVFTVGSEPPAEQPSP
jgi:hypothetical protein